MLQCTLELGKCLVATKTVTIWPVFREEAKANTSQVPWWPGGDRLFCHDFSHCALPWGIIGAFDWPTTVDGWQLNCSAESIDFSDSASVSLCVEKLYMGPVCCISASVGWLFCLCVSPAEHNTVSVCSRYTVCAILSTSRDIGAAVLFSICHCLMNYCTLELGLQTNLSNDLN